MAKFGVVSTGVAWVSIDAWLMSTTYESCSNSLRLGPTKDGLISGSIGLDWANLR